MARLLALEDLRYCRDGPERVRGLFRKLSYRVDDEDVVPLDPDALELPPANARAVERVFLLADHGELQVWLFELSPDEFKSARFRALAQELLKRPGHYLWVCAPSDYTKLAFVHPRRALTDRGALKAKVHKLVVDTAHPTRHDLDILEGLACGRPPLSHNPIPSGRAAAAGQLLPRLPRAPLLRDAQPPSAPR